jgi:PadR family transcriptional regulator
MPNQREMDGLQLDTTQLLKGVLDLAVLAVLAESDSYGYDVVRRLREKGLEEVGDASVYGTLRRLFQAGALTSYVIPSESGPHRKYYALNDRGRATLDQSARSWNQFTRALNQVLNGRSVSNGS